MSSPVAARLAVLALVLSSGAVLALHGARAPRSPGVALSGAAGPGAPGGAQSGGAPASGHAQTSASQTTGAKSPSTTKQPSKGPLLSSTQVAPYTYEVYPTAAARLSQAESGFRVSVKPAAQGEASLAVDSSQGQVLAKKTISSADTLYWIETSYGDDAPGADANYGDDGYVLTDAQGYITQK